MEQQIPGETNEEAVSSWSEQSYILVRWARVSPILVRSMLCFAFTVWT